MEKRKVIGYEDLYEVDERANIYSLRTWRGQKNRIISQFENEFGYLRVHLTKNGKTKGLTVHKVITRAFLGEIPEGFEVRHLDGNKKNNHISNLCYGTAIENAVDRSRHKKTAFGEKIGTSKISNQQVIEIRNSKMTQKELAKKYNVSIANISMILNYKSRKNG